MAVTVTNAAKPVYVGYTTVPPRVETQYNVDTANVNVGDFVILGTDTSTSPDTPLWKIWADSGAIGGIYLGQDSGIVNSIIPSPGIDVVGKGVFNGEGSTGSATPAVGKGAVLVLTPGTLIEMDTLATASADTIVPGLSGGISGKTLLGAATDPMSGFYFDVDGTTSVDDLAVIVETLSVSTGTTNRGRAVVRITGNNATLVPGG